MKIYKLQNLAELEENGEYRLGKEELNSGAVYLVYGRLRPGEKGRKVVPEQGHEEIICVLKGSLKVRYGKTAFTVTPGEAFHSTAAQGVTIDNIGEEEAVFIASGGRHTQEDGVTPKPKAAEAQPPADTARNPETVEAKEEEQFEITRDDSTEI